MDIECLESMQSQIDQKLKPVGSLGKLESLALQLGELQSHRMAKCILRIEPCAPHCLIFCADHGVAQHGVSVAPQQVTRIMLESFLGGHAASNCFCFVHDVPLTVVDAGCLDLEGVSSSALIRQSQGPGTKDFSLAPAMTTAQVSEGLHLGGQCVESIIEQGANVICLGEMGIGNTTSASALLAALTGWSVEDCVGRGSGVSNQQLFTKSSIIRNAVARCINLSCESIVAELGGFEIVQLAGAIIKASSYYVPVVIDGFIVSVAAYIATLLDPSCRSALIFSHVSHEHAHQSLLNELNAEPLLDLGLRLGEGTGALLAVPLIRSAIAFFNEMASFSDVGVEL